MNGRGSGQVSLHYDPIVKEDGELVEPSVETYASAASAILSVAVANPGYHDIRVLGEDGRELIHVAGEISLG
jgi:hypothetical protein